MGCALRVLGPGWFPWSERSHLLKILSRCGGCASSSAAHVQPWLLQGHPKLAYWQLWRLVWRVFIELCTCYTVCVSKQHADQNAYCFLPPNGSLVTLLTK